MVEINSLESMLELGQDNALIRFTLGSAFMQNQKYDQAIEHLAKAVEMDPSYSAAWKNYGKALEHSGRINDAIDVYKKGINRAETKGDKQTAKEMNVFLKRLSKK